MSRYKRTDWGARPARPGPGRADPSAVRGVALHWPAMSKPVRGVEQVKSALRSWQSYHMDDHGWSDIAYQEAIDQDGNVYALRGLRATPAANGNQALNTLYGALLLVLAPGEQPTEAMVKSVRRRVRRHRQMFPNSRQIVGHGDIRPDPTACPGVAVTALIRNGALNP